MADYARYRTWEFQKRWKKQLVRNSEVVPVPVDKVPRMWKYVVPFFADVPDLNLNQLYQRLLSGEDKLWAVLPPARYFKYHRTCLAALTTTITHMPPSNRKCFEQKDPRLRRSLRVHLVGDVIIKCWLDSAVERVTRYAREQECHQLFVQTRPRWRRWAMQFYSPEWHRMGFGRDRPSRPFVKTFKLRNKVGHYAVVKPAPPDQIENGVMNSRLYHKSGTCYFHYKEKKHAPGPTRQTPSQP